MESKEFRGYLWPEGDENNQIPGVLSFEPTKLPELDLFSNFYPPNAPASGLDVADLSKRLIHGITEDAERVTLLNPQRTSLNFNSNAHGSLRTSKWVGTLIITGFPFGRQNPALNKVTVSFYGQDEWARWGSVDFDMDMANPPYWGEGDSLKLKYQQPQSLSTQIGGTKIKFSVSPTENYDVHESGSISLSHEFKIVPNRPRVPISEFREHIDVLRKFVTFGLGEPTSPSVVTGNIVDRTGESHDVELFFPVDEVPSDISVHPNRMLFRGEDLALQYEFVMKHWYNRSEDLSEVFRLYFETVFGTGLYSQNRFLNLAHALEAYHRLRWWDTYITPGKYGKMYDDLMDILARDPANAFGGLKVGTEDPLRDKYNLPNDFVVALRNGTFKYANEVSLGRRLKDILSQHGHLIQGLPYNIDGKNRKVVNTRHYFSHWDDSIPSAAGAELIELTWGLQQLIEACLLDEIGIPERQIRERLHSRYENRGVS